MARDAMTTSSRPAHADASEPLMHVVSGAPTAQEQAAVEAVLVGLAEEWAETKHRRVLDTESEWQAKTRLPSGARWKRD
ncbi:acyl-CoA carboxylase epsilon subunit [Agrococcus sp. Marseille-P2731]|uniref:acyl-CoA carboxylase epsilon subunit n=1 Tax=Agrococcus sp. Marseille-P2731 TaxID=1841862 RepID=UPI00093134F6|nr:acyl-CoA carboxylase epsilon subunit [Agrococcus sp. Marseille-P2731]